ncbi:hypothetical protein ABEB36_012953 [Hypothenemus hampei]|uniref:MADF domain-containing protein n=1 Tax=Hypothenemus hampei TaxID=57062 RepID=A0ABD1E6A5_HYPHA
MVHTEKLIEIVKRYPILYDLSHGDYKNVRKKDKVWEKIGAEINESGDEVKKKWKNLRDSYIRNLKSNKTKTDQAAKVSKKWQWSDQMEMFRPFLSFSKTSSNISDTVDNNSESLFSEHSLADTETTFSTETSDTSCETGEKRPVTSSSSEVTVSDISSAKKKKTKSEETSSVNTLINYFQNKKKNEGDETDMLFAAYARTIKKISKKRQVTVKMKIAQIVMNEELLDLEEQTGNGGSITSHLSSNYSQRTSQQTLNSFVEQGSPQYSDDYFSINSFD